MKFKSIITTTMFCLISIVAMAKDITVFSVQKDDKNIIDLNITNLNEPEVQISLKDFNGTSIYNETLTQRNINHRKYDLKNLPAGQYTLIAAYDDVIKVQTINKGHESVEILSNDIQTIYSPSFRQHSEFVDLNMLNSSNQTITVQMTDEKGHVVYSENNRSKGSLQKRFNLSQLERGVYTLTLAINGVIVDKEYKELINWIPTK